MTPKNPYPLADMRDIPLKQPIESRIEMLCSQLAEAGNVLAAARHQYEQAARARDEAQGHFASLAADLQQAIAEHQEGVPEGMPYAPYQGSST